jgi:hypothetical protein
MSYIICSDRDASVDEMEEEGVCLIYFRRGLSERQIAL